MIALLKVGILTHHNIKNYGAYLQAYALLRTIESLGHEVTVVNFINFPHVLKTTDSFIRKPNLKKHLNIRDYILVGDSSGIQSFEAFELDTSCVQCSHINALDLMRLLLVQ